MTPLCDSPLTLQYIYKAYGLIELDRRFNSPFTRPPEQRWLLLCSWFSKNWTHFARLPYPRRDPQNSDFLAPMVLKSTVTRHEADEKPGYLMLARPMLTTQDATELARSSH